MKFSKFVQPVVDLSDNPKSTIVTKLKKGDLVVYEGEEYTVEFSPKKAHKGVWLIGLTNNDDSKYIRLVEDVKPQMTDHEKKQMIDNIDAHVKKFYGKNNHKLLEMIPNYHYNLSSYNNYDESDVREVMSHFPLELLKESNIVL